MRDVLVRRSAAVVAAFLVALALVTGDQPARAAQLDGVPDVISLGGVAPATAQPNDVVRAWPSIAGAYSFLSVQLVDEYGGAHVLNGAPGVDPRSPVPDWWPAGHYRLGAISVTAGTLFGGTASCFYCYAYYDFVAGHVFEGAYDEGFTGWRSADTPTLPFSQAEIDALGLDVVNPGEDVAIADLETASIVGGDNGAFPAGAAPKVALSWGVDERHPYQSGSVTVIGVRRGVDDPSNLHVRNLPAFKGARTVSVAVSGLPNGRYRVASVTLLTDNRYQLDATADGSTRYPPGIGGGAVLADLSTLRFSVGVPPDVTPPTLDLPDPIEVEAVSASGASVAYVAAADDNVDGPFMPSCAPVSGATFALGTTAVSCSATDEAGNTTTGSFDVSVVDTTAPVLTVTGSAGTYDVDQTVSISCTAADAVSAVTCSPLTVTASAASYGAGTETLTFTATDAAGNTGTTTTTFEVTPTVDGMVNLTTRLVTKPQLAGSLAAKLRAGSFDAYRQQLRVQADKAIAPTDATLLVDLSYALSPQPHGPGSPRSAPKSAFW